MRRTLIADRLATGVLWAIAILVVTILIAIIAHFLLAAVGILNPSFLFGAPSDTDIFATVAMSGASTTLMKSNSPSVAHWWSTVQPSSSTSWFTCRRRSGFDLSVCTPC